jgi:hypothetical protein
VDVAVHRVVEHQDFRAAPLISQDHRSFGWSILVRRVAISRYGDGTLTILYLIELACIFRA